MSDYNLFQELKEDLERQRVEALWKKYSPWIITVALGVVLATAGGSTYRSWKVGHEQRLTDALLVAKDGENKIERLSQFAEENPAETLGELALLHAAALALENNDVTKAGQIYEQISNDSTAKPAFRQMGALMAVHLRLDDGDPAELMSRLEPLVVEGAVWRYSAMQDMGYLALRAGDTVKAKRYFSELAQDARVPQSMGMRAAAVLRGLN